MVGLAKALWDSLWTLVEWGAVVVAWAIAHPVAAIVVGIGLLVGAYYLREQPWAGADTVANLVSGAGEVLLWVGGGAYVVAKTGWTIWALILAMYAKLRPTGVNPWGTSPDVDWFAPVP